MTSPHLTVSYPRCCWNGAVAICCAFPIPVGAQQSTWSLVPERRYVAGTDIAQLTDVRQLIVDEAGRAYVGDRDARAVYVFDSAGDIVQTVGRSGRGPGEFHSVSYIGWLADTLWVADRSLRRFTLFDPSGQPVGTIPLHLVRDAGGAWLSPRALLSDGTILVDESLAGRILREPEVTGYRLFRFDRSGAMRDTVRRIEFRNAWLAVPFPGGMHQGPQPWTNSDLYAVSAAGDRLVVVERPVVTDASAAVYRLIVLNARGRVLFQHRVRYHPIPLTDRDVDRWLDGYLTPGKVKYFPSRAAARRAVIQRLYRPEFLPPVRNVLATRGGMIWVLREEQGDIDHWDVFNGTGARVATATVPAGVEILEASGNKAWGVEKTDYDVPVIVRYRIRKTPSTIPARRP